MKRTLFAVAATAALAAAGASALPASAAGEMEETYTATVTGVNPIPVAQGNVCDPLPNTAVANHRHVKELKLAKPGTLEVDLTGAVGDWDLVLEDKKGANLAESAGPDVGSTSLDEKIKYKIKKAGSIFIVPCNFAGVPTATIHYKFTPSK